MQVNNWKQNKQKIERALDCNTTCVCLGLGSPDEGICKNYVFGGVGGVGLKGSRTEGNFSSVFSLFFLSLQNNLYDFFPLTQK